MIRDKRIPACGLILVGLLPLAFTATPEADFTYPLAVATDGKGTAAISDTFGQTVWRFADGTLTVLYKGQRKYRTPLYTPRALTFDAQGNLYICDPSTYDVYRLDPSGKATPLTKGQMDKPMGVVIGPDGKPVVSDLGFAVLETIEPDGKLTKIADVPAPTHVTLDRDGSYLVVSRGPPPQLVRVSRDGKVTPIYKGKGDQFFHAVLVDPQGDYILSDGYKKTLWRITHDGKATPFVAGAPFDVPEGMAYDTDGTILVADPRALTIWRVTPDGKVSVAIGPTSDAKKRAQRS